MKHNQTSHMDNLSEEDWKVWNDWFTDQRDRGKHLSVFRKIGYTTRHNLELYRALLLPLDMLVNILSSRAKFSPRMIASWTHDITVADRLLSSLGFMERLPGNQVGVALTLQRKIPAKNIVWDSKDPDLLEMVRTYIRKYRPKIDSQTMRNMDQESEVIVAGLPQQILTRNDVVSVKFNMRTYGDAIRQRIHIDPSIGIQSRNSILLHRSDIDKLEIQKETT